MNKISKKDYMYFLCSLVLIIIDQIIKLNIQKNMNEGQSTDVIKGLFSLTYVKNKGAAFGILQNQKYIFLIIGTITIIVLIYIFLNTAKQIIKFSICMIISGAFGNMIDRIAHGYVIDMFDFHAIWSYVFNFADICVVVGIFIFGIIMLMEKD